MAHRVYTGDAVPVAQVTKLTPSAPEAGDIFTVTINRKDVSVEAEDNTVAGVCALLAAAINASTIPEFTEILASDAGTHVLLTARTAGVTFKVTASTTNSESGNVTVEETTEGVAAVNEVQKIELQGTPSGGTFTLSNDFGSGTETTGAIAYNASAATVQAAIEALATPVPGDVLVTGPAGGPWFLAWQGSFAEAEVPEFTVNGGSLTGAGEVLVETISEGRGLSSAIQMLRIHAGAGTYRLSLDGQQTAAIAYNATAAALQSALEALANIGSGNVVVYGGQEYDAAGSGVASLWTFAIKFTGDLAGTNVSLLLVTDNSTDGSVDRSLLQSGGQATAHDWYMLSLGAATGTFRLTYDGEQTASIDAEATGDEVEDALDALAGLAPADVIAWNNGGSRTMILSFASGSLAGQANPALGLNSAGLTGGAPTLTHFETGGGPQDEQQRVTIFGTGGTFTLTFDGQTTAATAWNASAATLETNLEALSNITAVSVSGAGTPSSPYIVTFENPGDQDVAEMTGDASSLTGGGGTCTEVTAHVAGVNEEQTITLGVGVTSGTFTLEFLGVESAAIAYNANAAAVQSALEAVSTIGSSNVSVTGTGPWVVEFVGDLAAQDVELLVADGSNLVGGSGSEALAVETTTFSAGPNHADDPDNWTDSRVPDSGDTVHLEDADEGLLYGLTWRQTFTVNAGTDVLTLSGDADFVEDQIVRVRSSNTLPAGLSANTDYYIKGWDKDARTMQLSASSGGSAVNITDTGTGTHTIEVQLAAVRVYGRHTGEVGLPQRNDAGYYEYRALYWAVGLLPSPAAENVTVGIGDGQGSGRLRFDFGASQILATILNTGGQIEPNVPPLLVLGSHASNELEVLSGEVGVALGALESATLALLTQRGGAVTLGNVTLAAIDKTGGTLLALNDVAINGAVKIRG